MNNEDAIEAFTALAQETRLSVFRLLVQEVPNGLPVGEISRQLEIVPSTLSGHLGVLKRAGLLNSTRYQREIHYAANLEGVGALIRFIIKDCCNGQVRNCEKILSLIPFAEKA
ncbi:MAG: metalloregulator ArsR/SmtB family transcription factor [Granulosicoccaceae bacterium]